ncbi:hypothetical protein [Streptomyces marincola]|uniref:hypothetical protein n=1 Tax=Streptomyces marincola TaxID=2878388 RepID=UPI001CF54600|nr:hypothetical protein [Streptomyces marincola]UCM90274.1 hypothetical protein LC193_21350 [Streptomyces marincola]
MTTTERPSGGGRRPRPGPPPWVLASIVVLVTAAAVIAVILLGDEQADPEGRACHDFADGGGAAGPATAGERAALAGAVTEWASRSSSAPFREAAAALRETAEAGGADWTRAGERFTEACRATARRD